MSSIIDLYLIAVSGKENISEVTKTIQTKEQNYF